MPSLPAGTIRGALIDPTTGQPPSGDLFLILAAGVEQDPDSGKVNVHDPLVVEGSPFFPVVADADGVFTLSNIPAGEYFLVLGKAPAGQEPPVVLSDKAGRNLVADLTQGYGIDLGEILVVTQ